MARCSKVAVNALDEAGGRYWHLNIDTKVEITDMFKGALTSEALYPLGCLVSLSRRYCYCLRVTMLYSKVTLTHCQGLNRLSMLSLPIHRYNASSSH